MQYIVDVFTETLISSDHIVFCLDVISVRTDCGINIPPESPIMICHFQTLPDLRWGLFPTTMPKIDIAVRRNCLRTGIAYMLRPTLFYRLPVTALLSLRFTILLPSSFIIIFITRISSYVPCWAQKSQNDLQQSKM